MAEVTQPPMLDLEVDGVAVSVPDRGGSLLDALREDLGLRSAKDGCSPQGQCGCCTVLVDGQARVACVTPARRVAGRAITTVDGLDAETRARWSEAFCATGASQCGFCTPGIVIRLEALRAREHGARRPRRRRAGAARPPLPVHGLADRPRRLGRDGLAARRPADPRTSTAPRPAPPSRAAAPSGSSPAVALGGGGFADDAAPADALVAVLDRSGEWVVGETLAEARQRAGKVQGRRTTVDARPPLALPEGEWAAALRTSWVEPAYLEPDASWCRPGEEPASPLANGGAFGGKRRSEVAAVARRLADEHGRAVRVLLSREDAVRRGPKRPPVAGGSDRGRAGDPAGRPHTGHRGRDRFGGARAGGRGGRRPGPPTSTDLRAAGWAEATVLLAGARGSTSPVVDPVTGAIAEAEVDGRGVRVRVRAGDPLDEVVLRSYAIGAAHMALSWMSSEGIAVDDDGIVHDLTIRSFGILRAVDTPPVHVEVDAVAGPAGAGR